MKQNVGKIDRSIRILAGLGILFAGLYTQSWWGLVGFVPLLTATTGWCPAYVPFGISTCKVQQPGNV